MANIPFLWLKPRGKHLAIA